VKYIIGIDPGVSGSLSIITDQGEYVDHLHMPVMKVGKKNRVNAAAVARWLKQYQCADHCYIEKVGAMPKQGTASMFSFGHAAGIVEGVVVGMGIPMTYVTPQAWEKHTGLIGKDKDAARTRAIQLYPDISDLDLKGKGQALADSILIARANC
tara:strand:- start:27590 stop:28048 length:459 start_codon:yes stop_codon:yes gene_type:complete